MCAYKGRRNLHPLDSDVLGHGEDPTEHALVEISLRWSTILDASSGPRICCEETPFR